MNISKRTREDAIMIASIAACCADDNGVRETYTRVAVECFGDNIPVKATDLATDAWYEVHQARGDDWSQETDAEVAQVLAEGWCPGDPVHPIKQSATLLEVFAEDEPTNFTNTPPGMREVDEDGWDTDDDTSGDYGSDS